MAQHAMRPNELTDADFEAALERGRRETERDGARTVRYDIGTDAIAITVNNGVAVTIPRALMPGLERATPEQLKNVELSPSRTGIRFRELDEDYTISALLRRVLGLNEQQRAAGSVTSEAKRTAAAANGAQGGRPRKTASAG